MPEQLHSVVRQRQVVEVRGRKIELAALTLRDYVEVRNQALSDFKRQLIRTWTENIDLLPAELRQKAITAAFEKAGTMTHEDMPAKQLQVPVRDASGKLQRLNGKLVSQLRAVDYAMWWISETLEGKLFCAWLSMRACEGQEKITLDEASAIFTEATQELDEAANVVSNLSAPRVPVPNQDSRPADRTGARRQKKLARQRRREARRKAGG